MILGGAGLLVHSAHDSSSPAWLLTPERNRAELSHHRGETSHLVVQLSTKVFRKKNGQP